MTWSKTYPLRSAGQKIALTPLIIVAALVIYYWPLWEPSFNPAPQVDDEVPRGFEPTPEELEAGAEILRASGILEQINGGQTWEPIHRVSGHTWQRGTRQLRIEAKWAEPVTHSGPWSWRECDEPRKVVVTYQQYSNMTILEAWVDLDEAASLPMTQVCGEAMMSNPSSGALIPSGWCVYMMLEPASI